jgi:NADPH-ferrihemoprotein reductase
VRCLLFAISGLTYETADNLAILPENDASVVTAVAAALGYSLDMTFHVELIGDNDNADAKYSFPSPCTVRDALTKYFDLQGHIRQSTLTDLLPYVTDSKQKG